MTISWSKLIILRDMRLQYQQEIRQLLPLLYDNFLVHYGFPARLHSDQGRNFESAIIQQLCIQIGTKKCHTTPYHAHGNGNGAAERFNATLLSMLGTLTDDKKADWKSYVSSLVHAYNSTRNDSTRHAPFYLMFGRHLEVCLCL